jgi:hypothetical protein
MRNNCADLKIKNSVPDSIALVVVCETRRELFLITS